MASRFRSYNQPWQKTLRIPEDDFRASSSSCLRHCLNLCRDERGEEEESLGVLVLSIVQLHHGVEMEPSWSYPDQGKEKQPWLLIQSSTAYHRILTPLASSGIVSNTL